MVARELVVWWLGGSHVVARGEHIFSIWKISQTLIFTGFFDGRFSDKIWIL